MPTNNSLIHKHKIINCTRCKSQYNWQYFCSDWPCIFLLLTSFVLVLSKHTVLTYVKYPKSDTCMQITSINNNSQFIISSNAQPHHNVVCQHLNTQLRSPNIATCEVPRTCASLSDQSFTVATVTREHVRDSELMVLEFRQLLKRHLFSWGWWRCLASFVVSTARYKHTYTCGRGTVCRHRPGPPPQYWHSDEGLSPIFSISHLADRNLAPFPADW